MIHHDHQRRGIGSRCVDSILKQASQAGLPVELRVFKNNPRALVFYHRLGFEQTVTCKTHIHMRWEPA